MGGRRIAHGPHTRPQVSSTAPVLSVRNLSFQYGDRHVLQDISFDIGPAEKVILLGPNGAGKTTLFSLIAGLFDAAPEQIEVNGSKAGSTPALASLGMVFQLQTLDLDLSVDQNLRYAAALHGLPRTTAGARMDAAKAAIGLADRGADKARSLNGGHRRRVEIARASLHSPTLMLLDEPTVGLDIQTRKTLVDDLHDFEGALLWATHLIDEVAETDRVLVLHRGRIVADGRPADLMHHTGSTTIAAAFNALTGASA